MTRSWIFAVRWMAWLVGVTLAMASATTSADAAQPNIVLIYADDLGYGDIGCNGSTTVRTPHIDRLAKAGLRFTDAHASAATCTPSRYSLLTGEYAWRRKGTGILPGNAALIIEPGRETLASLLKDSGYRTGVVGKWHLGLGSRELDWNGPIKPGPLEIGFDYCYLIPATGDRVPCVYVEDHRVVGLDPADPLAVSFGKPIAYDPTSLVHPELLKMHPSHVHDQTIVNGISRIGYMTGGKSARWVDEDMADVITAKAVSFIEQNQQRPFFLFFSTHDIHVPRVPHARFVGSSGMGPRGDAIVQFDWCVGQIMDALDRLKLSDNTLLIVTSDNGPVVDDGYRDQAEELLGKHQPSGPLRGGKYSAFEAGTRVPFIVHWPGGVQPGVSSALVCQVDLAASLASLLDQSLHADAFPASLTTLGALLGSDERGRDHLVEQAGPLSVRRGDWKNIEPKPGPKINRNTNTELGTDPQPQLYFLQDDLAETTNVAAKHPEKVVELQTLLKQLKATPTRALLKRPQQ